MLSRLIEFALTQRMLVLLATALLIAGGAYAFQNLPIDAFPDVSPVQVKVIMKAPGMTPEEVEARITTPIEVEMLGIPNKKILRSVTKYALTDITIDFEDGTDIYWARSQVAERLNNIMGDMPPGISGGLAPITTPLGEMFMFTIDGGDLSLTERRTLLDWTIRPALRTLPGVADVNALGGLVRSFEVVPDNAAMRARGVTMAMLQEALENNNRNDGAGRLRDGEEVLLVRSEGSIKTLEDTGNIIVAKRDTGVVQVSDVAEVRIGSMTRYGVVTMDGKGEAVQGLVLGLRGANAQQVVDGVKNEACRDGADAAAGCEDHGVLRPQRTGRHRRWHGLQGPDGSHRAGDRIADSVSGQLARGGGGGVDAAAGGVVHLHSDAAIRHVGQSDEPGRAGHRHRPAGRCGGGGGGKHRFASGA